MGIKLVPLMAPDHSGMPAQIFLQITVSIEPG
jgi:hypothetical protein